MNYLSHYVFNHRVCGLPVEPYFAVGVVLPDLWLRFSRQRRLCWRAVRTAAPAEAIDRNLRAGLLNHVVVDRAFHNSPLFVAWQRTVRAVTTTDGVHPALADFLVHMAIELVLDQQLLHAEPGLADRFYDVIAACDPAIVARRVGVLGAVDATGLDEVIRQFVARRFLRQYRTQAGLADVVRIVLELAEIPLPPERFIADLLTASAARVAVVEVWPQLRGSWEPCHEGACGVQPAD
jgi:hypothetical protein